MDNWKSYMKQKGFVRKSIGLINWHAFFRVHGDGILQVIRKASEKGRKYVDLGLFSLYGEILPQWLTCHGCIPRYEVMYLAGRSAYELKQVGVRNGVPVYAWDVIDIDEQIHFLCEEGLCFLDRMSTHQDMIEGIKTLDYKTPIHRWNDDLLYPAYLAVRDWDRADMVISAILEQHSIDSEIDTSIIQKEEFESYARFIRADKPRKSPSDFDDHETELIKMLRHIRSRDEEWRLQYTETNFRKNVELCRKMNILR